MGQQCWLLVIQYFFGWVQNLLAKLETKHRSYQQMCCLLCMLTKNKQHKMKQLRWGQLDNLLIQTSTIINVLASISYPVNYPCWPYYAFLARSMTPDSLLTYRTELILCPTYSYKCIMTSVHWYFTVVRSFPWLRKAEREKQRGETIYIFIANYLTIIWWEHWSQHSLPARDCMGVWLQQF